MQAVGRMVILFGSRLNCSARLLRFDHIGVLGLLGPSFRISRIGKTPLSILSDASYLHGVGIGTVPAIIILCSLLLMFASHQVGQQAGK